MLQDQFISPDFESTDRDSYSYLGLKVKTLEAEAIASGLMTDLSVQYAPAAAPLSYLNVAEFFWNENSLAVGRKKQPWSRLDEHWNLGLFQPIFKWNPLRPEQQGLTGAFWSVNKQNWGVSFFASSLFLPDQGPSYEIVDGQFQRANPWFRNPPTYARFLGQTNRVHYDLQQPQTSEVIFNNSYVGSVRVGQDHGWLFRTSLAYKPSNQLALGFDVYLPTDDTVQAQVVPKIYYHNLISGELIHNSEYISLGMTGVTERPQNPKFDEKMTFISYKASILSAPFIEARYGEWKALLAYLKIQGGEAEILGPVASNQTSILPARYPFREAGMLRISTSYKLSRKQFLDGQTQWTQGPQNEFSVIAFDLGIGFAPRWKGHLTGQLVAAADSAEAQITLPGQFQNNDSLGLGMTYVF